LYPLLLIDDTLFDAYSEYGNQIAKQMEGVKKPIFASFEALNGSLTGEVVMQSATKNVIRGSVQVCQDKPLETMLLSPLVVETTTHNVDKVRQAVGHVDYGDDVVGSCTYIIADGMTYLATCVHVVEKRKISCVFHRNGQRYVVKPETVEADTDNDAGLIPAIIDELEPLEVGLAIAGNVSVYSCTKPFDAALVQTSAVLDPESATGREGIVA